MAVQIRNHSIGESISLIFLESSERSLLNFWMSSFRFRKALLNSLFRTALMSWLSPYGKENERNLGVTLKTWQFFKNWMSNSAFLTLMLSFSSFRNSETDNAPSCFRATSWIMLPNERRTANKIKHLRKRKHTFNVFIAKLFNKPLSSSG